MLSCVVNVSEGRRAEVLGELAAACGEGLLDVHADPDHHRSVFTLAGEGAGGTIDVVEGALRLARAAAGRIDLSDHRGVHPRLGVVDVVPFVALHEAQRPAAVAAARDFAERLGTELGVPVFLYGEADPGRRSLPELRREAFITRAPDFGPPSPHPTLGAVTVGARPPMVAVNCDLASDDLAVAATIARGVRERDGGLPGVRALAFYLASRERVQVSMNLVDLGATGVEAACVEVRRRARRDGTDVVAVELVGLLPGGELARCSGEFLAWAGLGPERSIEARLRAAGIY